MILLANNIRFIAVVVFAVALIVYGLLRLIGVLKNDNPVGHVVGGVLAVIFVAAVVIWAADDFTHGGVLVDTIGAWFRQLLTEPLG